MGGQATRWQGVTTLRARAREEEQRRQRGACPFNRVRSVLTQKVISIVVAKVNVNVVLLAEMSGQLRSLG